MMREQNKWKKCGVTLRDQISGDRWGYLISDEEDSGCLVMAFWPDRSFAVIGLSWGVLPSADRLYEDIDQFGDPLLPLIVVIVDEDHLPMVQVTPIPGKESWNTRYEITPSESSHVYRFRFKPTNRMIRFDNAINHVQRGWVNTDREKGGSIAAEKEACEIPTWMKHVPAPTHDIKEVQKMDRFVGVYIGFISGEPVYVGESVNIPGRLKNHEKLKGVSKVTFIACAEDERKRIESFFIGTLNPHRNSQSSTYNKPEHQIERVNGDDGITNLETYADFTGLEDD